MPLLLLDLDNTLVDRAGAFRAWASDFVDDLGLPPSEVDWLIRADRDGYERREVVAGEIRNRFALDDRGESDVLRTLRLGLLDRMVADPAVPCALLRAKAAGWRPYVITNGTVEQQERKLHSTGLDRCVDGWVVSEGIGLRKPDARMFAAAAQRAGQSLNGAWMIGDSGPADIGGAHNAGLQSIWLARNRRWNIEEFAPTRIAADVVAAIDWLCRAHVAALDPTSPMRDHEQLGPDRRSDAPNCS